MPTPEQQKEYWRLSDKLIAVAQRHLGELPKYTVSLSLRLNAGTKRMVACLDKSGKQIGTVPNDTTSSTFLSDLERAFEKETFSDAIIVIISNPMTVTPT
jgi:hypothetical protein